MARARVQNDRKHGCYFLTPTIRNWYYIFDRHDRWDILAESLKFFQKNKGLKIFSYVFMLNHIHLIVSSEDVSGFLRDFKSFTSKQLRKNIEHYEPDVLKLFLYGDNKYQFWKEDNQPKYIDTDDFFLQKLNYIHQNPVKKGYVTQAEHWKWSSANPGSEIAICASW